MPEAQLEATTSLYVPTIDDVATRAFHRAGLVNMEQTPTGPQLGYARGILSDMLSLLEADGVMMRAVQPGYLTLVAGQNVYTLPENVIDIMGNGAYIDPTQSQVPYQASSETPVVMKDRDTWQDLTSKSAQSRPYIGYFARNAPQGTLYVWPTPSASEDGGQIRFQYHVTRPDVTVGTNTIPFERYWTEYFVWGLAARIAFDNSLAMDRVQFLGGAAAEARATAKAYSKQNVSVRVSLDHRGGWSNRSWRR